MGNLGCVPCQGLIPPGSVQPDAQVTSGETVQLVLVSDPGQDLDDEMTFIMLRFLVAKGLVELKGIVTTLAPAFDRARLCRGTLDTLGLYGVPVGVGTDGGDVEGKHQASTFEEWAHTYMPATHSESAGCFEPGRRLLYRLYKEAAPKSLTLVVIAALKDPALFLRDNEELFESATREVVIMGGVDPWDQVVTTPSGMETAWAEEELAEGCPKFLTPDTAHNNTFDTAAAKFFYRRCQELGIRLVVVSRHAAYAAKVPRSCYDDLAALGSAIGCRLRNAQRASIEALWARACLPAGHQARHGLPDRCDRTWFLNTFCNSAAATGRTSDDTIWDLVVGFMQYDTIATLAALPSLRSSLFSPEEFHGMKNTTHLIIGQSERNHGVSNPEALNDFLKTGFSEGIAMNHTYKARFILITHPRWNNRADELIACVMFRALYELGCIDCIGIIVSPGPGDFPTMASSNSTIGESSPPADVETTVEQASKIEGLLKALGLAHVPVLVSKCYAGGRADPDSKSAADHLKALYERVPPAGVSLVVTAALGDVNDFAERHSKIFRERTQAVVLVSGALLKEGCKTLEPDPISQNNRLDLLAARRFFKTTQDNLVPLVILSRHFSRATGLPRTVFDALGSHGGTVGAMLYDVQKSSITRLWKAACAEPLDDERRGLPLRCNRRWFLESFCRGQVPESDDNVWPSVKEFCVYGALAILATVPTMFSHIAEGTLVTVRGVSHTVVGISADNHGVRDLDNLRTLLFQSLFMGTRLNASEFDRVMPPPIEHSKPHCKLDNLETKLWQYDPSEEALDWLLQAPSHAIHSPSAPLRVAAQALSVKRRVGKQIASGSSSLMAAYTLSPRMRVERERSMSPRATQASYAFGTQAGSPRYGASHSMMSENSMFS